MDALTFLPPGSQERAGHARGARRRPGGDGAAASGLRTMVTNLVIAEVPA